MWRLVGERSGTERFRSNPFYFEGVWLERSGSVNRISFKMRNETARKNRWNVLAREREHSRRLLISPPLPIGLPLTCTSPGDRLLRQVRPPHLPGKTSHRMPLLLQPPRANPDSESYLP